MLILFLWFLNSVLIICGFNRSYLSLTLRCLKKINYENTYLVNYQCQCNGKIKYKEKFQLDVSKHMKALPVAKSIDNKAIWLNPLFIVAIYYSTPDALRGPEKNVQYG